ncbi:MAG TPA: nicotinate-nucleotide--dimethylbenzimidazole phosphoribosyltransferase [Candidatus Limnocylindrales bacterium]|jgi:nicotinate-nucleotide--dimethylbenzimidazole phosphoribosyltransferase|nr:nicotinate-nucleotide--dimethylbenzimidazole phosphoribosyltransferase [Candidatus Limnocylindrales bacterium]
MSRLETIAGAIAPLDLAALADATRRQRLLAKPPGSLGRLEWLSIRLAGIRGGIGPLTTPAVVVMAADHGVAAEGVSAYPATVTAEMVRTFLAGGAAINAIAAAVGARVVVVDMGVSSRVDGPELIDRRIAAGTRNLAQEPAMSRWQAKAALEAGIGIADVLAAEGVDLLVPGEMGIANTTSASCIVAAMTGHPPSAVTGRGTGIDEATRARKIAVIERALARQPLDPTDPVGVLGSLGGFEIGGLAGLCLGAASHRIPVVLDGLISTAAALIAVAIAPLTLHYLIAGHQSVEPGHRIALRALRLRPLLRLEMRLGEGTGAALAIPIVRAATETLATMTLLENVVGEAHREARLPDSE